MPDELPPDATPFEPEIRAFEAEDRRRPPPRDAVLFVGSSSIRLWTTLADDFPAVPVINRGFGGSELADSVRYAHRIVTPYAPPQIVLYAGDNDLAAGKTPAQVSTDLVAFVRTVRAALPRVPVAFISIKPSPSRLLLMKRIRKANELIREFARDDPCLAFIDVFTPMLDAAGRPRAELFIEDALHLNRTGYELWAAVIRPYVIEQRGLPCERRRRQ